MEGHEVGIAFLDNEGAEGKAERYIVECVGFLVGNGGEYSSWDGELEGWGHSCGQSMLDLEMLSRNERFGSDT